MKDDTLVVYYATKAMVSLMFLKNRIQDDNIKSDLDHISGSMQEILNIIMPDTSSDFIKRMAGEILKDNPQILPSMLKLIDDERKK
jgi:hypothetical protein